MNKYFSIMFVLLTISSSSFSQKKGDRKYTMIIGFGEIYKSNLIELSGNSYGNIYLLASNNYIDPVLNLLSEQRYSSKQAILDTFKNRFDVYIIRKDTIKKGDDFVTNTLTDGNYYLKGYLFFMNDEVKKYGPVNYYIIKQHVFGKIQYQVLDIKGGDYHYEQVAVVKEISQREE